MTVSAEDAFRLLKLGRYKDALSSLNDLISGTLRSLHNHYRLLRSTISTSNLSSTERHVVLISSIHSELRKNAFYHFWAGECCVRLNDQPTAIQHYSDAIVNMPEFRYLVIEQQRPKAVRLLHASLFSSDALGGRRLFELFNRVLSISNEMALQSLKLLVDNEAGEIALSEDGAHFAKSYAGLGRAYMTGSKQFRNAIQAFETAMWFLENTCAGPQSKGTWLFDMGFCYYNIGMYRQALSSFERALTQYTDVRTRPSNYQIGIADCHLWIGMSLFQIGKLDEAQQELQEALKLSETLGIGSNIVSARQLLDSNQLKKNPTKLV